MTVPLAVLLVFTGLLLILWVHDLQAQRRRARRASQALADAQGRKRLP